MDQNSSLQNVCKPERGEGRKGKRKKKKKKKEVIA